MIYSLRFSLASPIIIDSPLHLDSLLSAVHPAMHNTNSITRQSGIESLAFAPLALDSAKLGNAWVWCCSAAEFPNNAKYFDGKFTKRRDGTDLMYYRGIQQTTMGIMRDKMEGIYGVSAECVEFYLSTPEIKEVERITRRIKWLGGLRKMGYGEVKGYDVNEMQGANWRDCIISGGKARRNLPLSLVSCDTIKQVACKPPYWYYGNKNSGIEAGEACELKEGVYLNELK